ncbi:hypothetical protein HUW51_08160 [Adhaeribacter swui]|uniref:Outer membrane beta-barrel protein n=1 Tax=Adhaeribacter swui TaxID=2086471 RepID=A0A7G7G6C0_9BACT|nr:hypothetical protein [Adhaeribacter swui]QNF32704.1 hypothetical protein HUW51_08160 [Adhaeribacter swui]
MKFIGCLLFSILCSLSTFAQSPNSGEAKKSQLKPNYVGLRLNNTSYYLNFNQMPYNGFFAAWPILHVGYYLTKRSSLQIGVAYGKRKFDWANIYNDEENKLIEEYNYSKSRGIILPITWRYILNPTKRFQYFGSVSMAPAYGSIFEQRTGKTDQLPTFTYQATAKGFNAFITGTLEVNYQISKQWEGNAELILFNRNVKELTGTTISPVITGSRIFKVIGFGVNYKL